MIIILVVLALLCCVVPFLTAQKFGVLPLISPLHFIAVYAFFGVFTKTLGFAIDRDYVFFSKFLPYDDGITYGYLYLLIYIVLMCLAYALSARKGLRFVHVRYAFDSINKVSRLNSLFFISVGIFFVFLAAFAGKKGVGGALDMFSVSTIHSLNSSKISRIDGVDGYGQSFAALRSLLIVPKLSLLIFIAKYISSPSRYLAYRIVVLAFVVIFSILVTGKRMDLVAILIYVVCIWSILGVRIDYSRFFSVALSLVIVLIVFSFLSYLRSAKSDLSEAEFDFFSLLFPIIESSYFLDINMSILIVELSSDKSRFYGETYFWWLFGWIPRDIWPDKPAITLGPYVKQEVLGLRGTIGGINPTGPGEAFLNFGWGGVFVGAALGIIYRKLEELIMTRRVLLNGGGLWIYPLIFYPFIEATIQSSFSASIVGLAAAFLLIKFVLLIVAKR